MTAYLLTFDRAFGVDFPDIHEKITGLEEITNWFHYIKSSYILVSSVDSANVLNEKLLLILPEKMLFLLIEVDMTNNNGRLPSAAWEWIQSEWND